MAYIPLTYSPMENDGFGEYKYTLPLKGARFSVGEEFADDGKAEKLFNMDIKNGALETRKCIKSISDYTPIEGNLNCISNEPFCERVVLHIGEKLYTFAGNDEPLVEISSSLPDKKSIMCPFLSKLYIYCDRRIFSLDNTFSLVEEIPYAPLFADSLNPDSGDGQIYKDIVCNLLAPCIKVKYDKSHGPSYNYMLPYAADPERPIYVYINGEMLPFEAYSHNAPYVKLVSLPDAESEVEFIYYIKNESRIGFESIIENCSLAETFGGNMNSGTRIYFTGNPEKKGYYFKSDLQDPLNVSADSFEIIGDGCEDITAMKKMYGDLIIFTERTVYRMSYNLGNDGAYYTLREIGNGAGCDCPGSICLIDNRVVFLNSKKGVFIIDSTERTGEQNIKPVSGNILLGKGDGLLENSSEDLKNCCSIDFDRKYMLFAGEKAYIWDYDKGSFYDSGSYSSAQERLVWYLYKDVGAKKLYNLLGKLTFLKKSDYEFFAFDGEMDGLTTESGFSSGKLKIGKLFDKKQVSHMNILFSSMGVGSVTFTFYADGVEYCVKKITTAKGERRLLRIGLPKKTMYVPSFDITSSTGIRIEDISLKYRIV